LSSHRRGLWILMSIKDPNWDPVVGIVSCAFAKWRSCVPPERDRLRPPDLVAGSFVALNLALTKSANRTVINSTIASTSQLWGGGSVVARQKPRHRALPLPLGLLLLHFCCFSLPKAPKRDGCHGSPRPALATKTKARTRIRFPGDGHGKEIDVCRLRLPARACRARR
jgi:hypothetical protein